MKKPNTAVKIAISISFVLAVFIVILLALDVFTVPYLTPFAHFLKTIITPFVPLLMPIYIGAFLKTCRHTPFPSRKQWMCTTGAMVFQQCPRVLNNLGSLYEWNRLWDGRGLGLDVNAMCGLEECLGSWAEVGLIATALIGEWCGWKWDAGYVQKWVDAAADESIKQQREASGQVVPEEERMEKGQVGEEVEVLDEKKNMA